MTAEIMPITPEDRFDSITHQHESAIPTWSRPFQVDPRNDQDVDKIEELFADGTWETVDRLGEIADGLFEYQHPQLKENDEERAKFVNRMMFENPNAGNWFAFPWSKKLVRFPEESEYKASGLRYRDRKLIEPSEHEILDNKKIAFVGLSVGRHALTRFAMNGIGNQYVLADPDTVSLSNLNRFRGGMQKLGMNKADDAAIEVSEHNPYIEIHPFRDGINDENLEKLREFQPDLIIEAVDHLPTKARLRLAAKKWHTPLMMVTDIGHTTLVDVERYDIDPQAEPFGGRLPHDAVVRLANGGFDAKEMRDATVGIVGMEHVSARMMRSLGAIGTELGGFPQLDSTAAQGGVAAVNTARRLFLGEDVPSSRQVIWPLGTLDPSAPLDENKA